ncbi:MAG TPA: hypothetical protein VEB19_12270, partial [Gemmatimonadaceae bacterium]|nr:hypothetical protein [Gemmatimonadaceae bacterium]
MRHFLAASVLLLGTTTASAQDVLVQGARVFDGVTMLGVRDVLVTEGRIARVDRNITPPAGVTIVDGSGKTLLPGLIDAHTHTFQDVLRQALAFGVTTQLEMFTDPRMANMWRQEQRQNRASDRADIFSSGVLVTAKGGHGTQFGVPVPTIGSPDSAQSFVDARIAEGSDYIKIVYDDGSAYALKRPTLDKATLKAIVAAAHARNKLAVVHVHSGTSARDAVEVGADGLVHVHADRDEAVDAEFVRLAVANKAFVIPTLSVNQSVTGVAGGVDVLNDPRVNPLLSRNDLLQLNQAFPTRPGARARYVYAESLVTR